MVAINLKNCLNTAKKVPQLPKAVKTFVEEEVRSASRYFNPKRHEGVDKVFQTAKKAFSFLPIFPKGRAIFFGEGRVSKCLEKIHSALSSKLSIPASRDVEDSTGVASLREQSHLRKTHHKLPVDRKTFSAFYGSRVEKMRAPFAQAVDMLKNFLEGKRDGAFFAERAASLLQAKNSETEFVTYAKRVEGNEAQNTFVLENARLLHQQVAALDKNSTPIFHFGSVAYAKKTTSELLSSITGVDKASKEQKQFLEGDLHVLAHELTRKFLDPIEKEVKQPSERLEKLAEDLQAKMPRFLDGIPSATRDLFLNVLRKRLFGRPAPDGVAKLCDTFCDELMKNGLEETLEEYILATLSNSREFVDQHFNDFRYFLSHHLNAPLKELIAESSLHLESDKRFWMEINKQEDGAYTLRLYTNDRDGIAHPLNHLESGIHYPLIFSGIPAEKMSSEFFEQLIAFQTYDLWDKERTITLDDLYTYLTLHLGKEAEPSNPSTTLPNSAVDGDNAIDWLQNYVHHHCLGNEEDFSLLFEYQMPLEFLQNLWTKIKEEPKQLKESSLRRELKGVVERLTNVGLNLHEKGKISDGELTALFGTILDVNEALKTEKKAKSEAYEVRRSNIIPEDLQHVLAYIMDKTGLSASSLEGVRTLLMSLLGEDFGSDFDALVEEFLFDFNRTKSTEKEYESSFSYAAWRKTFSGLNDRVNVADLALMTTFRAAVCILTVLAYSQKAYLFQWLVNSCLSSLTGKISFKVALLIVTFGPSVCQELLPKELHEPLIAAYDLFFEVYTYLRNRILLTGLRAAFHGILALKLHPKLSEEGLETAKKYLRKGVSHVSHGVEVSYDLDVEKSSKPFSVPLPTEQAFQTEESSPPATWDLPRPKKIQLNPQNLVGHLEGIVSNLDQIEKEGSYQRDVQTRRREALAYIHGAILNLPLPGRGEGGIWKEIQHPHLALNHVERILDKFTHLVSAQKHTHDGATENIISLHTLFAITAELAKQTSDSALDQDFVPNAHLFEEWLSSPALTISNQPLLARAKELELFFSKDKQEGQALFNFLKDAEKNPYIKQNLEFFQTYVDPGKVIHTADLLIMNPNLGEMQTLIEKFGRGPKTAGLQALDSTLVEMLNLTEQFEEVKEEIGRRKQAIERALSTHCNEHDLQKRLLPLGLSLLQKIQESARSYTHFDHDKQKIDKRSSDVAIYPFSLALEKVQEAGDGAVNSVDDDHLKKVVDWLARGIKGAARYFGTAYKITGTLPDHSELLDTERGLANRFTGVSFDLQSIHDSHERNSQFGLQVAEMLVKAKTLSQAEIMQDDSSFDTLSREEKFLLAMAARHSSDQIVRCMDFFTSGRGRLSQQRYRTLFETLMNNESAIKAALEDEPAMIEVVGAFFDEAIQHFLENDDYATALFLAKTGFDHLVHSSFYAENAKAHFPNFRAIIREQILPNFRAQATLKPIGLMEDGFVGSLLYLTSLYSNLIPDSSEKEVLLDLARLHFARTPMAWKELESEASAKPLRTLYMWEPLIHDAIQNDSVFRNTLLDTLVADRGGEVTNGPWEGDFPRYTKGAQTLSLVPQEFAKNGITTSIAHAKVSKWVGEKLGPCREISDGTFIFSNSDVEAKFLGKNGWLITRKLDGKNFRLITNTRGLPDFVSQDPNSALWIEQKSLEPIIYCMKEGKVVTTHHAKVVNDDLENPTLEITKTSPLSLDQAKFSGLAPLHWFQSSKDTRVETEGEKVKKIAFPKMGLTFEVDKSDHAISTDGSTPGFWIAKQQKVSSLVPFANTLLLENERGEKKAHIIANNFKELFASYLVTKSLMFNRDGLYKLGNLITLFLLDLGADAPSSSSVVPLAISENIKKLLEEAKFFDAESRKMYTYDLDEKGQLQSQEPCAIAYLALFYVVNGQLDQLFPIVKQLDLLSHTSSFPEELFPLLDTIVLFLSLRKGKKATELLLKLTAMREANSVLHQEEIPAANRGNRLLWLIVQSNYKSYLESKESSLNEFEELYILNSISRQNREFSHTNTALNSELEQFGLGNFVESMAMLPSLARRYQVLRAQFEQGSTWRLKAEKLIVNTLFGEGHPKLVSSDGKVAPISTFRKISQAFHQLFRFARNNCKDYIEIEKDLRAAIHFDTTVLDPNDFEYFTSLHLSPSNFTKSFLKEHFFILYHLACNELPEGWRGNREREQLFANKIAELHRAMSLTVGRFKDPESRAIWLTLQTAVEQTPLHSLLGSSLAYLLSMKQRPIATGTKTVVAAYNSSATALLLEKLQEMPLPAATKDFIESLKSSVPSSAEALLHSLSDKGLRPASIAFLRSLKKLPLAHETLQFIASLEKIPLPTTQFTTLPKATELKSKRDQGSTNLDYDFLMIELGKVVKCYLIEQAGKASLHTVTGYKVLDSKLDALKAAGVATLGTTFSGLKVLNQVGMNIGLLKAQLVTYFTITRTAAALNAVVDPVAEPTPQASSRQLSKETISQMNQRERAISNLLSQISEEYFDKENIPATAEEHLQPFDEDDEASVKEAFERLNESLHAFYSKHQPDGTRYHLKKKKYAVDLMRSLHTLQGELSTHLAKERAAIVEFVNHVHIDSLDPIEKLVADTQKTREERDLTFEDISMLFAQENDAKLLKISHMQEEDLSEMKRRLYLYHLSASRWQFLFDRIGELSEKPTAEELDQIGQELNRERTYKFNNSSERVVRGMLLFESKDNVLLRGPQARQLERVLRSEHRRVVTGSKPGSGKTSIKMVEAAKNKADGEHLVLNIWPKETAEENTKVTAEKFNKIYNQKTSAFTITRSSFKTVESLIHFFNYLRSAASSGREPINMTKESLQALELNMLEAGLNEEKEKFSIYRRILHLIHEKGFANFDEAHSAYNPNKKLIYPFGPPSTLPKNEIGLITEILGHYATISQRVALPKKLSLEEYKKRFLPSLARTVAARSSWDFTSEEQSELVKYFTEEAEEIPGFITQSPYRGEVAAAKGVITSILSHSLNKIPNVDFGRSKEGNGEVAKPSSGNENVTEQENLGNPREALVKSGLLYLHRRLSDDQIENLIEMWREKARSKAQDNGTFAENTQEVRLFKECCGGVFHLFHFSDADRATIYGKIRASDRATLYYLTHKIAPQITFYKKTLAHNPMNFGSMTQRSLGYTATQKGGTYPNKTEVLHDPKEDGESLDALARAAQEVGGIRILEASSPHALLNEAVEILKKDPSIRIYTDRGAHANGIPDREVVQELLKWTKGGVVFYEKGSSLIWEKGASEPVPISQGTSPLKDRLTYFSQPQTFAADVKQTPGTKAILTISEETTLSELVQAFGRNRNGKNIFVMTKDVRDRMTKNQIPSIREIIRYVTRNEAEEALESNFQADILKMQDLLRSRVLNKMRTTMTDWQALRILKQNKSVFLKSEESDPWKLYGQIRRTTSPANFFNELRHQVLSDAKETALFSDEEISAIDTELRGLGRGTYPKEIYSYHDQSGRITAHLRDLGSTVEVQEQQEQSQQHQLRVAVNVNEQQKRVEVPRQKQPSSPWPSWVTPLNLESWFKVSSAPIFGAPPVQKSFGSQVLGMIANAPVPNIYSLKDVLIKSGNRHAKKVAEDLSPFIYSTNNITPLGDSGRKEVQPFGPYQIPPGELLLIQKEGDDPRLLLVDQDEAQFWRKQIRENRDTETKFSLVNIANGAILVGSALDDPRIYTALMQLRFLRGDTHFPLDEPDSLEQWVKRNPREKERFFKFVHGFHGKNPLEGSLLEAIFEGISKPSPPLRA
ncbi:MAG: DUF3638 domain-containing protein [Candidatus Algichlamydia australiensis]|nr:DUF3638 domain-containing protein [Chlamydiales bacterium]